MKFVIVKLTQLGHAFVPILYDKISRVEHVDTNHNIYTLGTQETSSVTAIAKIISDEMELEQMYSYTGGDCGWTGYCRTSIWVG